MKSYFPKILITILFISILIVSHRYGASEYLSLEYIKQHQAIFTQYYAQNSAETLIIFFFIYVATTALSIPGATILSLLAGALFGFSTALVIISFASTFGASIAFLGSRFLFRDYVQSNFSKQLKPINNGFKQDGAFYLFSLRLIPVVPFFIINLSMGLTSIKLSTYYWVSQLGMLLGTAVYINAGLQLSTIESISAIFSWNLLLSFALLGLFPLIAKKILKIFTGYNART
jgi:uncharacterized membrane protein YdjX (TVP38/TMEM64 family)